MRPSLSRPVSRNGSTPSVLVAVVAAAVAAGPVSRNGLTSFLPSLDAQVRPIYDRGAAGLSQVLQRLQTTASVLHTGAHPDDEDSAFIARTARGDHARVAYLSLTRGEGGQNVIGSELFEALGVIRTEELLQARRLDGGEQFFTRAIDFGFSKTRAESASKWNDREVLDDMVRVIRTFRPMVIVSRFTGTEADGHGHHQLAGYLTPLAFRAAGRDDEFAHQFAEGLRRWQPLKLYRTVRQASEPGLVEVVTGALDPVIGRTYAEIAAEGRSQHKSQEMGAIEPRGDLRAYLRLLLTSGPAGPPAAADPPPEQSIFDDIDTTVPGIARLAGLPEGALRSELQLMTDLARQAFGGYQPLQPSRIVPALAAGLRATRAARTALRDLAAPEDARAEADVHLAHKENEFAEALSRAAGIVVDALSDQETVPQGSSVSVAVRAFYPDRSLVRITGSTVATPSGWNVSRSSNGGAPSPGRERPEYEQEFVVSVPASAAPTQPYFLSAPRDGDRYTWSSGAPKTLPFEPGPLVASVTAEVGGVSVTLTRRVDYRYADRVRGEIRRAVNVVPPITVAVDTPLLIVPIGASTAHRVAVTATNHSEKPMPATVRLQLPAGWTSSPVEATFAPRARGDRAVTTFVVTPPPRLAPGRLDVLVNAVAGGVTYAREMQTIAYPHIETHRLYRSAGISVRALDLKVAPVAVGYVMGSGDQVPDALRRMGVTVTLLDNETLARGDLSRFDSIVVGIRASEARPDFAAEHARLMEYVTRGGTLIVQYQQTDYVARGLPPYPAAPPQGGGNSRVTDETAPVTILAPGHPVFTFPNRITAADFEDWVQERNLYAFPLADPRYTPLLETADPGEPGQRGGEVYAEIGKGRYVYTAFSWFRQLPAGVPGAYRQFANLISLPKAPR
jgi:LmbE family N-acetylglucosaminyl deacetylase